MPDSLSVMRVYQHPLTYPCALTAPPAFFGISSPAAPTPPHILSLSRVL